MIRMPDIMDRVRGQPTGGDVINAIGAMINVSGRRCFVIDTESATELYEGEVEIDMSDLDLS